MICKEAVMLMEFDEHIGQYSLSVAGKYLDIEIVLGVSASL